MRRIRKMTAKQKKLFVLTSMMSVFVMAAAVLFAGGKFALSPFSVRGSGEIENATITWNASSTKTGSGTDYSFLSKTSSGTGIYLYSKGYWAPSGDQIFDGKTHESITKGIFVTSEAGNQGSLFSFQNITKVSVTTGSNTKSSSGFIIYAHGLDNDPDVQQTSLYTETPHTYNFNITNGTSLVIFPKNTYEVDINSVTITYSCTPGSTPVEKSLSSISISGQTTELNVNDSYSFGGVVTAHYSDSSTSDVTASSTFSGYNMDVAGSYEVVVSYTESGVTKTTSYTLDVVSQPVGPFVFSGKYNYSSRGRTVDGNTTSNTVKDWTDCMSIEFKDDGTCVWANEYKPSNSMYSFKCVVNFTYVATFDGTKSTLTMTHTTYDFKRSFNGGAYETYDYASAWNYNVGNYDRPINAGYGSSSATNNTGVLTADRSSLTISTYVRQQISGTSNYEFVVYDTLTFSLAS